MNMPKFTAEASLYQMSRYYVTGSANFPSASKGIYPAYQDQNCLNGCLNDCGSLCAGTAGSGKSACVRECAQENKECRRSCERVGNPPVPSPVPLPGTSNPRVTSAASTCPRNLLRTETSCPFGGILGLWCRDFCQSTPISSWYPCGICLGGDI